MVVGFSFAQKVSEIIFNEFHKAAAPIMGMDFHDVAFWKTFQEKITMGTEQFKLFLEQFILNWTCQIHVT
jgi:homoserine trans-succinylase